ncbi:MAG: NAD(P)H-dependent oxidoreductase subunit E [Pirellulales bacterium]|nr:NAD(P)H-dependent oxidoreductase subunit E [Pirellulales bacterium]
MLMPELDLHFIDQAVARLGTARAAVIPILQAVQNHYRYLPPEALERICKLTEITPADVTGVATFFTQFRHRPVGEHIIRVCHGTACHVKGAGRVQEALERELGLGDGEDTDARGVFTVEKVACLGCCTLAPVVQIDGLTYGRLVPNKIGEVLRDFLERRQAGPPRRRFDHSHTGRGLSRFFRGKKEAAPLELGEVRVGLGSCCVAQGSGQVHEAIERVLAESGAPAVVKRVGCVGMCHQTPLVELVPPGGEPQRYARVPPESVPTLVLKHFRPRGLRRRIAYAVAHGLDRLLTDEPGDPVRRHALDVRDPPVCAFLGPQRHVATEQCGRLDPTDLEEYLRYGGFHALKLCLAELTPEQVIAEVQSAGLRGRGGAGFPTGEKWDAVRRESSEKKYILCNGDEGDPGAFMDRMLLESFPYRIIEGMLIAAYAVGAGEGMFYIRAEYPLAVRRIREALRHCEQKGYLGQGILGTDFSFHLTVQEGAGAFVCGEETALIATLEGRRGMPRLRPPYPAQCGLWGKPTLVNNVETYALVPWIFRHGAAEFARLGTPRSKGTKVFALAGKVRRGGLIEVPMGVTIRQVVEEIGGGVAEGRTFKAVQVGGPSGGCVPAALADTPIDFEALADVGAIMGSGGLVVLDDSDCMVDIARYFLRFIQDQSCGKCTFCRVGTRRMLDILNRICDGHGKPDDLETLENLAEQVRAGSICGLGRTAPNPILSTLRYFREEYEAHLQGRCPAGRCKALIQYRITEQCIGCTLCAQQCPVEAIPVTPYAQHTIDLEKCTRCDTCRQVCPADAVVVEKRMPNDEGRRTKE